MPMGVERVFLEHAPAAAPPTPRAAFTSNPLRGLGWLLDLWASRIHPRLPAAELHVFSGAATYGSVGDRKAAAMAAVIDKARGMGAAGVVLRGAMAKPELADALSGMRAWLYRGDAEETFCFAAAEAQAMGVPAVVGTLGSLPERVRDSATGFVAGGDEDFAERALRLLTDDALWGAQHDAALARRPLLGWDHAAARFEALLPEK
jgi:glycosyltransferase involved in cell wall biosynthesis